MEPSQRQAFEDELVALCARGEFETAASRAIGGYGPELLGFLAAIVGDVSAADDVFSAWCEDVWRGLPSFERRASVRTWLYTLARHAAHRFWRRELKRADRQSPLEGESLVDRAAAHVRTTTIPWLRSAARDRLTELRESLPVEDQMILILRVDKQLDWDELVDVLHEGAPFDAAGRKREAARLRKRFQLVKDRLREQARKEGLLGSE
ncbi:MAG TPA: sigma-70 family RNA polymerase sigma factor [Polyangia bacterium]|nr:sigma-70 family RNA polymerase sigma factor [Polyangia bacterium]